MSNSEISGGCTSIEDGMLGIGPLMAMETAEIPAQSKLGQRTRRRGQSILTMTPSKYSGLSVGTVLSDLFATAGPCRKRRDTASELRRIRVVGRFASPTGSRETSTGYTGYNSGDSDTPCSTVLNHPIPKCLPNGDPNDADDEAEINKELTIRGRSREVRRISVSSR